MNYYNEFDPFAAAWLRELIKDGLIPAGIVDERSITDVHASDLNEYTQCHFFAGIGGWSYALALAGWPSDRPVWTGSCPCQPFSTAGKGKGQSDERHLWPVWFNLIKKCRPSTVFGEQVAAAISKSWFDDLRTDMESEGYATGMVVLPACSVGAPHKRDRLFFVADSSNKGLQGHGRFEQEQVQKGRERAQRHDCQSSAASTLGNADRNGLQARSATTEGVGYRDSANSTSWADSRFIECADGKFRQIPTEPAFFPLADGLPGNRVGILRGAGNAIVPALAAEFIKAAMI